MLVDIKDKIKKSEFPIEIFNSKLQQSIKEIAYQYNIPVQYLGTTILFTIAALSGSMYTTELNGNIRNIFYFLLLGPSGLGKTPAYYHICGKIIEPLIKELKDYDNKKYHAWKTKQEDARLNKQPFDEPEPHRIIRMIQGGTMEGIMKHAEYSKCGFGNVYDEGGRMFGSPNAYKKDNSSTDFWNELFNGNAYLDVRADNTKERLICSTAISVCAGMQTDRISKYFTKDAIESGLPNRFLITSSDFLPLNENVDHFSKKGETCTEWKQLVEYLFEAGIKYSLKNDSAPTIINFTSNAKKAFNTLCSNLIKESNLLRSKKKDGDISSLMIAYESKLYSYVGRFLIPLSILDNPKQPTIEVKHVESSEKLYRYYRREAEKVFTKIFYEQTTDLNENERALLNALPEQFTFEEANKVASKLNLSDSFFDSAYKRKYRNVWITKVSRGKYEKV